MKTLAYHAFCHALIWVLLPASSFAAVAEGSSAQAILDRLSSKAGTARVVSETHLKKTDYQPASILHKIDCGKAGEGYLLRDSQTGYLLEFALPEGVSIKGAKVIDAVPNLQQFHVHGDTFPVAYSGCVPTAGGNLLTYWASHGFPEWASFRDQKSPTLKEAREVVVRLRESLPLQEEKDSAFTDDDIPLTGTDSYYLALALEEDAAKKGIHAKVGYSSFSEKVFAAEIEAGRPTLVGSMDIRVPQKPGLTWGHELTGVGYLVFDGVCFVGVRDNFLPLKGVKTRWIWSYFIDDLITVVPSKAR